MKQCRACVGLFVVAQFTVETRQCRLIVGGFRLKALHTQMKPKPETRHRREANVQLRGNCLRTYCVGCFELNNAWSHLERSVAKRHRSHSRHRLHAVNESNHTDLSYHERRHHRSWGQCSPPCKGKTTGESYRHLGNQTGANICMPKMHQKDVWRNSLSSFNTDFILLLNQWWRLE